MSKITFVPNESRFQQNPHSDSWTITISIDIPNWLSVTDKWDEMQDVLNHIKEGYPMTLDTKVAKEEEDVIVEKHSALQQSEEDARKSDPQWATW